MAENNSNPQILSVGFGKVGHTLHGPNWLAAGYDIVAYDPQANQLDVAAMSDPVRAAYEAGRVTLSSSFDQISLENIRIVDVVAASGYHLAGVHNAIKAIEHNGRSATDVTWLLEKPVVSSPEEEAGLKELMAIGNLASRMFVNENYNASTGVTKALEYIGDTPVTDVDVVFYKDRVPDVKKGRFTDPQLGAYGIEMPHILAIAHNLAGISEAETQIVRNDYFMNVAGVPESTGNYTVVRGRAAPGQEVTMRMAQGLGPYEIDATGKLTHRDLAGSIIRYSNVTLADGGQVRIEFDPIPGLERYTSRVSQYDAKGKAMRQEVVADNMLAAVISGVAHFDRTGEYPSFAKAISVSAALGHVHAINRYVEDAKRQGNFPQAQNTTE